MVARAIVRLSILISLFSSTFSKPVENRVPATDYQTLLNTPNPAQEEPPPCSPLVLPDEDTTFRPGELEAAETPQDKIDIEAAENGKRCPDPSAYPEASWPINIPGNAESEVYLGLKV